MLILLERVNHTQTMGKAQCEESRNHIMVHDSVQPHNCTKKETKTGYGASCDLILILPSTSFRKCFSWTKEKDEVEGTCQYADRKPLELG